MKKISIAAGVLAVLLLAAHAIAHMGAPGQPHGLINGVKHPICGVDHVLAMLGVGIWSALAMPASRVLIAPIAFVAAMLVGALAGVAGASFGAVNAWMAISVVVMGLLIATRVQLPAAISAVMIGAFGLMLGYLHGPQIDGAVLSYAAAFALTTGALHLAGSGFGRGVNPRAVSLAAGGAMASAGISLLVS